MKIFGKILLLLQTFFLLIFFHTIHSETTEFELKPIILWKGEIIGVYENQKLLKIQIYRNYKLPKTPKSQEEFRNFFFSQKWKIYYPNGLEWGEFQPRDLIWLKTSQFPDKKDETWEAKIWGETIPYQNDSHLPVGSYIAHIQMEPAYVEPHSFFGKKGTPLPKRIIHEKDGKEMVLVDRGVFLYGQGIVSTDPSFHPEYYRPGMDNLPDLEPYYIDKYEVTNGEYARYIKETNSKPPQHWKNGKYPEGEEHYPVDYLSYEEVQGYAKWAGKRLPTEWEWEKAARGPGVEIYTDRQERPIFYIRAIRYPFGDEYNPEYCNTLESGKGRTISVYELPTKSASPYGAIGMCGNVAEWTSSWYDKYPGQPYELNGYGKFFKVIRGGSYRDSAQEGLVYHRSYGGIPNLKEDKKAGFRLVKEIR